MKTKPVKKNRKKSITSQNHSKNTKDATQSGKDFKQRRMVRKCPSRL